jgi:putative FmdB family regulatory protein
MPTYDYKCKDCHHKFEAFHSMSAEPLTKCPKCGGRVERLIGTGAGVLFKGSGFYETDYRSSGYRKDAKADKSSSGTPKKDKKSASKKDAKKAQ